MLSGRGSYRLRIDQTVTAYPDLVITFGKIRHHITPPVIGDGNLAKTRWQTFGLRDDPNTCFGSISTRNHSGNVICIDRYLGRGGALRARFVREDHNQTERDWERQLTPHTLASSKLRTL